MRRSLSAVKREDIAVALGYNKHRDSAPSVVAVGRRLGACEVRKVARRYGIPVHYDDCLADKLSGCIAEEEIPAEVYDDVARVFALRA